MLALHLDQRAAVAVELVDARGRRIGREPNRTANTGPQTEILSPPASAGVVRVSVAAAPLAGAGDPTIATIAVRSGAPRLSVPSPTGGSVIRGGRVVVRLDARNFRVVDQGRRPRREQGHVHLTLDGRAYIVVYRTSFTFTGVPPGVHTLVIQPALNDHSPSPTLGRRVIRFRTVAG